MKALVTGATGGLGINLILRLIKEGYHVHGTGRNQSIAEFLKKQGAAFTPADLQDTVTIRSLCRGTDIIFHCGALSSPWGNYRNFFRTNVNGTQNVIRGCLAHDVPRLVHVSTPSIYFNFRERHGIKEDAPLPKNFANAYAYTKWMAEQAIDQAHQQHNLNAITIRPRAIFGPYDNCLLPRLIQAAQKGGVPLINGGQALIDVTYVENVVESLLLCAKASSACNGKKYNITNGEPIILRTLLEQIHQALDIPFHPRTFSYRGAYALAALCEAFANLLWKEREPTLTRYSVGVMALGQTLDITAAQKELGYRPKIALHQAIHAYAEWWKANKR